MLRLTTRMLALGPETDPDNLPPVMLPCHLAEAGRPPACRDVDWMSSPATVNPCDVLVFLNRAIERGVARTVRKLRGRTAGSPRNIGVEPDGTLYCALHMHNATVADVASPRSLAATVRLPLLRVLWQGMPEPQIWFLRYPVWETATAYSYLLRRIAAAAETSHAKKGMHAPLAAALPWPEADWVISCWRHRFRYANAWTEMRVRRAFSSLLPFGGTGSEIPGICDATGEPAYVSDYQLWHGGDWLVRDATTHAWSLKAHKAQRRTSKQA